MLVKDILPARVFEVYIPIRRVMPWFQLSRRLTLLLWSPSLAMMTFRD